jgi:hypothetical protein
MDADDEGLRDDTDDEGDNDAMDGWRYRRGGGGYDEWCDRVDDEAVEPFSDGVGGGVCSVDEHENIVGSGSGRFLRSAAVCCECGRNQL